MIQDIQAGRYLVTLMLLLDRERFHCESVDASTPRAAIKAADDIVRRKFGDRLRMAWTLAVSDLGEEPSVAPADEEKQARMRRPTEPALCATCGEPMDTPKHEVGCFGRAR